MTQTNTQAGGRTAATGQAPNAALLIDFDNVTLGVRSDLTKELRTLLNSDIIKGKVAVQRAYADWRRYPQYIVPLSESSIDLIFAPAFGTNKKNATDIRLAIDAIELVFTRPEIGTFILLSGDSDFSTMVIKLKEYGKYVIGVGLRDSASDLLIQNCDEYYSYSELAGLSKEDERSSIQRDPWELVREAVELMSEQGDVMRSDRLKQVMQRIDPNFEERNAGFNRFSRFVSEAADKGLLTCTKLENGQYEVAPVASTRAKGGGQSTARPRRPRKTRAKGAATTPERTERGSRPRPRPRSRPRRGDRAESARPTQRGQGPLTLAKAFSLMSEALQQLDQPVDHDALRLRMVTLHGKEDGLLEAGRFQRLLRQANDAEVVDVKKIGDDAYEVTHTTMQAQTRKAIESSAAQVREQEAVKKPAAAAKKPAAKEEVPVAPTDGRKRTSRYRRGSRAPAGSSTGPTDVPMVGVVTVKGTGAKKAKKKPTKATPQKAKKKTAAKTSTSKNARKTSAKATKTAGRTKAAAKKKAKGKAKRSASPAAAAADA